MTAGLVQRIADAIERQARWEAVHIPRAALTRIAESVADELQRTPGDERPYCKRCGAPRPAGHRCLRDQKPRRVFLPDQIHDAVGGVS